MYFSIASSFTDVVLKVKNSIQNLYVCVGNSQRLFYSPKTYIECMVSKLLVYKKIFSLKD